MNVLESEPSAWPVISSLACIHTPCGALLKTAPRVQTETLSPKQTPVCASG